MELKRVVITGLGTINPIGNNLSEYWDSLEKGVNGACLITHFDASLFKTKFACEVKNYDPNNYFDRKEAKKHDLFSQYAMVSTDEAIKDSQLDINSLDLDRVGVIWASGIGGIETFYQEVKSYVQRNFNPRFNPFFVPKMIADIPSGHISMKYGFRGLNFNTISACASSSHAIIDALNYIRLGKADIIITGGSEAAISEPGIGGFSSMHAISSRNDDYLTASRPFDKDRDGFVMGEGGATIIVEELEHAIKRGAKIYAELVGGGMSADAYHLTAPHPDGIGARNAMKSAIADAELKAEDIEYINVHGTSTPAGDIPEIKAIQNLFGEHTYKLNISATKSMTGHMLGAAGAAELIACIFAINKGVIPPTINNFNRDPEIDEKINLTLNKAQKRDISVALSNTFGFGGHNASLIVKKFQQ